MADLSIPFPPLTFDQSEQWGWPAPPLDWPHVAAPIKGIAQRCIIEGLSNERVRGELLAFDPITKKLTVRPKPDSDPGLLAFSLFRRLTLIDPLRAAPRAAGGSSDRIPVARQERDYLLHSTATGHASTLTGRTVGHVETAAGLFLFTPVEQEAALQRVFVPASAYSYYEFGPSAEELAARLWIGSPDVLLEAIEHQERMPVLPIGQSMLALGLLTRAQLDRELAKPPSDVPLGEALVAAKLISHGDLQTALAHKMGYPMVDLKRFPVDPLAVIKVPKDIAVRHRILPLMLDRDRLIVAVDRPSRVTELRSLHIQVQTTIVPVLASAMQITVALEKLLPDVWSQQVLGRPSFL
jgi:hypothetical protein